MSSEGFCEFVLDQLRPLGTVNCRPLSGGFALYRDEAFFAFVHQDKIFFCTDEKTRDRYTTSGMKSCGHNSGPAMKDYYEVPADVVEDAEQLLEWGAEAVRCCATAAPAEKS